MNIQHVLDAREKTHGQFESHANVAQTLKGLVLSNIDKNNFVEREAMSMILHKIARITNGDPSYVDHWIDIAGYAQLVVNHLEKKHDKYS